MCDVAFVFISTDFVFAGVTDKTVKQEVLSAAFISRTDDIGKGRNRHEIRTDNGFCIFLD